MFIRDTKSDLSMWKKQDSKTHAGSPSETLGEIYDAMNVICSCIKNKSCLLESLDKIGNAIFIFNEVACRYFDECVWSHLSTDSYQPL